jgi:nuclear transport factor 2 (NTF2) superfamily protein
MTRPPLPPFDLAIGESQRLYHWPLGRRPDEHPGLSDLGL